MNWELAAMAISVVAAAIAYVVAGWDSRRDELERRVQALRERLHATEILYAELHTLVVAVAEDIREIKNVITGKK